MRAGRSTALGTSSKAKTVPCAMSRIALHDFFMYNLVTVIEFTATFWENITACFIDSHKWRILQTSQCGSSDCCKTHCGVQFMLSYQTPAIRAYVSTC